MEDLEVIGRLGEGAHGLVLKARCARTGKIVAVKRVPVRRLDDQENIRVIIREVQALRQLDGAHAVRLLEARAQGNAVVLSCELLSRSLWDILRDKHPPLTLPHVKGYARQLLTGVAYLHQRGLLHRDLKPANLLLDDKGRLRIADFGLSRISSTTGEHSAQVATRWYRAPELLFGATKYNTGVDIWACGCVVSELINHCPLFPGDSDLEQIGIICKIMGEPDLEEWPELKDLPDFGKITFAPGKGTPFEILMPDLPPSGIDMLKGFLRYNPRHRTSANCALSHPFFFLSPLPQNSPAPSAPAVEESFLDEKKMGMSWNQMLERLRNLPME